MGIYDLNTKAVNVTNDESKALKTTHFHRLMRSFQILGLKIFNNRVSDV